MLALVVAVTTLFQVIIAGDNSGTPFIESIQHVDLSYGMAMDTNANLYVSGYYRACVHKIVTADNSMSIVAGQYNTHGFGGDGGPGTSALLNYPHGLFLSSVGNLFIVDYNNNRVRKLNTSSGIITTVVSNLEYPYSITGDSTGILYVGDSDGNSLKRISFSSGVVSTIWTYNPAQAPFTS